MSVPVGSLEVHLEFASGLRIGTFHLQTYPSEFSSSGRESGFFLMPALHIHIQYRWQPLTRVSRRCTSKAPFTRERLRAPRLRAPYKHSYKHEVFIQTWNIMSRGWELHTNMKRVLLWFLWIDFCGYDEGRTDSNHAPPPISDYGPSFQVLGQTKAGERKRNCERELQTLPTSKS